MEKIIFFGLTIPILGFVIYLGGSAIMKGFSAKASNKPENKEYESEDQEQRIANVSVNLSTQLDKLNELLKSGVLTEEEFKKAKKRLLDQ